MKRAVVLLAFMMILPSVIFAQLSIGPAVFLKSPVLLGQEVDIEEHNVNQFSFGGDVRYRVGWFQVEGLMLYAAGDEASLDILLDAGVAVDVAILTLSLGAGPNFTNNFGDNGVMQAGMNTRLGADVHLGPVMVGTSYIMALDVHDYNFNIDGSSGLLGVHVLFQM